MVEDDPASRRALQLVLTAEWPSVRVAADGHEALQAMRDYDPDVVVMDWRIPGPSGAELCARIRACPNAPSIVVVSSAPEAFEASVDVAARLSKPVDIGRLRAVIEAQLAARRLTRRSQGPPDRPPATR